MLESRWLRWVGPGVIAVGTAGAIASTTLGVGGRPWVPRICEGRTADRVVAARDTSQAGSGSPAALVAAPSFRLDPVLDAAGALSGQRLSIGPDGDHGTRTLRLPPESFAAGPFGDVVLVGSDDGTRSRLEAIDTAMGCVWPIADESAVIRRATIDRAGTLVYETRVERTSRADLGVWQRPLDGSRPARLVLPPLGADERFGRTFSTEFTWDTGGRRLAVQACGELACRTRIVDPDGGPAATVTMLDAPDLGPLVGLDGDRIVSYAACRGLPCPLVSTELRTGRRRVLVREGGPAVLLETADGARLVDETFDGLGRRLRSIALDGRAATDLGRVPDGLRLRTGPDGDGAAPALSSGWVLLAPADPNQAGGPANRSQLRHVPDGLTVPVDEALR